MNRPVLVRLPCNGRDGLHRQPGECQACDRERADRAEFERLRAEADANESLPNRSN